MIYNSLDACWPASGPTPTPTLVLYTPGMEDSWSTFAPSWAGNTYTFLTTSGGSLVYGANPVSGTGVKEANDLKIYFRNPLESDQWTNTAFGTVRTVDLTDYTTLHIQATTAESEGSVANYHVFGVTNSKTPPTDGTNTPPGNYKTIGVGETTLDISGVTGNRYVYFGGLSRSRQLTGESPRYVSIKVTKIWLT